MAKRIQGSDDGDARALDELPDDADRALAIVRGKLDDRLSVQYTVNQLIQEATNPSNLARIFSGAPPFSLACSLSRSLLFLDEVSVTDSRYVIVRRLAALLLAVVALPSPRPSPSALAPAAPHRTLVVPSPPRIDTPTCTSRKDTRVSLSCSELESLCARGNCSERARARSSLRYMLELVRSLTKNAYVQALLHSSSLTSRARRLTEPPLELGVLEHARRLPRRRLAQVRVGAAHEQGLDDVALVLVDGAGERALVLVVEAVRVGAVREEEGDDGGVAVVGGEHEEGVAVLRARGPGRGSAGLVRGCTRVRRGESAPRW